jgi:hypothetical protein
MHEYQIVFSRQRCLMSRSGRELRTYKPDQITDVAMFRQGVSQPSLRLNLIAIPAAVFGNYDVSRCGEIVYDPLHRPFRNTDGACNFSHAYIRLPRNQHEHVGVVGEH